MTAANCPTCDREGCPTLQPTEHIEASRGDCPACVAFDDCYAHRVDWRARALAAEADKSCRVCDRVDAMTYACEPSWEKTRADADRWRKVAPLIERLADDVRRRELIARAEFDRRVSDTVTAMLAATQEPTP